MSLLVLVFITVPLDQHPSSTGLGSIISVVRDLNELKPGADSSSASKWQNLVFTYDLAVDIATGKIDRKFALSSRQVCLPIRCDARSCTCVQRNLFSQGRLQPVKP